MFKKNDVDLSDYSRWKNTPVGLVFDTGLGDSIIAKVLEETGNEKAKDVFDTLRNLKDYIDDNIVVH